MKLRNVITKEICEAEAREDGIYVKANWSDEEKWFLYDLETLARGWEYYVEPAEPLIKDEKIRKAVRVWAEANEVEEVDYWNSDYRFQDAQGGSSIGFENKPIEKESRYGNDVYTIAELCGEEEE